MTYLSLDRIEDENLFLHIIYEVILHCPNLVAHIDSRKVKNVLQELHRKLFPLTSGAGTQLPSTERSSSSHDSTHHFHLLGCGTGASTIHVVSPDTAVAKPKLPLGPDIVEEEKSTTSYKGSTIDSVSLFHGSEACIIESNEEEVQLFFPSLSGKEGLETETSSEGRGKRKTDKSKESEVNAGGCEGTTSGRKSCDTPNKDVPLLLHSSSSSVPSSVTLNSEGPFMIVRRLSGGITNELFHVYSPNPGAPLACSVVVRIFGKETEQFISRESELFYQRLFLTTYVWGKNFLIYEYLQGFQPLEWEEMSAHSVAIADAMADFQVRATVAAREAIPFTYDEMYLTPSPLPETSRGETEQDANAPQSAHILTEKKTSAANSSSRTSHSTQDSLHDKEKKNIFEVRAHEGLFSTTHKSSRFDQEKNFTKTAMTKWIERALSDKIAEKIVKEKREKFAQLANALQEECKWMMKEVERMESTLIEGVCHNDLLCGNLMWSESQKKLKIIDFDYTHRNFLLFDLANHFNEYAGMEFDYKKFFPSDKDIRAFVVCYRQAMQRHLGLASVSFSEGEKKIDLNTVKEGGSENQYCRDHSSTDGMTASLKRLQSVTKEESSEESKSVFGIFLNQQVFAMKSDKEEDEIISQWTQQCKVLSLASHLLWAVWALLQEACSALPDVDFLDFGTKRFQRFMETKDAFKLLA